MGVEGLSRWVWGVVLVYIQKIVVGMHFCLRSSLFVSTTLVFIIVE